MFPKRYKSDCVVAAIANATGINYDVVFDQLSEVEKQKIDIPVSKGGGIGIYRIREILEGLGVKEIDPCKLKKRGTTNLNSWCCGYKAIVEVEGMDHLVSWDGFKIIENEKSCFGKYTEREYRAICDSDKLNTILIKTPKAQRKASMRGHEA